MHSALIVDDSAVSISAWKYGNNSKVKKQILFFSILKYLSLFMQTYYYRYNYADSIIVYKQKNQYKILL